MHLRLSAEDFREAYTAIEGFVHHTPLLSSHSIGLRCGYHVWLKTENLQKTGSFKPRGNFNRFLRLSPADRERGAITASAGNQGEAFAYVAAHQKIPAYVVMPESTSQSKIAAATRYGVHAILHGKFLEEAMVRAKEIAEERGLIHVDPVKDPYLMAGYGTIALEIIQDLPEMDAIVVPVGGGGLISAISMALRQLKPGVHIVGVEPAGSANMRTSRRKGKPVQLESVNTIADGIATRKTDPEVYEIVNRLVDDLVAVSDTEIRESMRFLLDRAKLLAEPAGALAVAALVSGKLSQPPGTQVVALISGGNTDIGARLWI